MDSDTVIMTPDQYLAQNVARDVPQKNVVWWEGSCIVHEQFTAEDDLQAISANGTRAHGIIAHPGMPAGRCGGCLRLSPAPPSGIIELRGAEEKPENAMLLTECSMASNIADALARGRVRRPLQHVPLYEEDHAGKGAVVRFTP